MAKFLLKCMYCNATWKKEFWELPHDDQLKCPICNDNNIKKIKLDVDSTDFFGYNWKKKDKK